MPDTVIIFSAAGALSRPKTMLDPRNFAVATCLFLYMIIFLHWHLSLVKN